MNVPHMVALKKRQTAANKCKLCAIVVDWDQFGFWKEIVAVAFLFLPCVSAALR
jgi:hypothetical protein